MTKKELIRDLKRNDWKNNMGHFLAGLYAHTMYSCVEDVDYVEETITISWDVDDPEVYGAYHDIEKISFDEYLEYVNDKGDE